MSKVFYRKKFSDYLGEQRALDDIIARFEPNPSPTPSPSPLPITPTPTLTPSPTPTPSVTPSSTPVTPTPTTTPTVTPTASPIPPTPSVTRTATPTPTLTPTPTTTPEVIYQTGLIVETCDSSIYTGGVTVNFDGAPQIIIGSGGTIGTANCVADPIRTGSAHIYQITYGGGYTGCTTPPVYNEVRTINFSFNPGIVPFGGFDYTEQLWYNGVLISSSLKQTAIVNPPADLGNGCPLQDLDLLVKFYIQSVIPTPTPTPTNTLTPTPTPTPVVDGDKLQAENSHFIQTESGDNINIESQIDADAEAYLSSVIASGGTLNSAISAATNTLFVDLKSAGLYTKLDAFYPMLGASSGSTSLNAIRTNSSFDITWNNVADLTFNTSGVTNNGSGYGDTNYNPNTQSSPTNNSFGYYIVGGNLGANNGEVFAFGSFDGILNSLYYNLGTNDYSIYGYDTTWNTTAAPFNRTTDGTWIGTFDSTPIKSVYKNASSTAGGLSSSGTTGGTPAGSAALPNQPYYLMVLNLNGSPYTGQYYTGRNQFAFMGDYLTPAEVITLDTIINNFQTSLGRNTY